MNQGKKANTCGQSLESIVSNSLIQKGFTEVPYKKWIKNPEMFGSEVLIKNFPFTSIYGHKGSSEFLLSSLIYKYKIRIECKWQQVAGSVDEKYPYLYLNCIEAMPEKDIIILLDGGGYKKEAKEWLMKTIKERKYQIGISKNIMLMNISEFLRWVNNI